MFEAANEQGRYAIGVDSDQALIVAETDPDQADHILTSMLKNVDNSIFRAITNHLDGTLPYGSSESLGIPEGGVGLAKNEFYDAGTPDEIKAMVEAARGGGCEWGCGGADSLWRYAGGGRDCLRGYAVRGHEHG